MCWNMPEYLNVKDSAFFVYRGEKKKVLLKSGEVMSPDGDFIG